MSGPRVMNISVTAIVMVITVALLAMIIYLPITGGKDESTEGQFEKAEYFMLEQKYAQAIPLFKSFLLRNPTHSGAHYYLGRCYFAAQDDFWLTLAEGEIQTALSYFQRMDKKNLIERFKQDGDDGARYFEMICNLDIAKIYLQQIVFLIENNGPPNTARALVDKAERRVQEARKILPESPDVVALQKNCDAVREVIRGAGGGGGASPRGGKSDGSMLI